MNLRRFFLSSLVLACGMNACATADVVCDMRTDYATEAPEAQEGKVLIRWKYNADLPPNTYGTTECYPGDPKFCLIRMKGEPSSYHNVCGIARLRHEERHAFGATHER